MHYSKLVAGLHAPSSLCTIEILQCSLVVALREVILTERELCICITFECVCMRERESKQGGKVGKDEVKERGRRERVICSNFRPKYLSVLSPLSLQATGDLHHDLLSPYPPSQGEAPTSPRWTTADLNVSR